MATGDTILVADDEPKIVEVLADYLVHANYRVQKAYTGSEAIKMASMATPSLIILDLMLPDLSGERVCAAIRSKSSVPILMLTAKHTEEEKIRGLQIGADDYVTKPFSAKEVLTRVQAILRRTRDNRLLADRLVYHDGDLVIDANLQTAFKIGFNVELTLAEFKLLTVFARYPRRALSREDLIALAFGMDFRGDNRTIDVHVKNIRSKIEDDPRHPSYIETLYGHGYRFIGGDQP